jgi:large subunit ribosomal protein L10
MERTQKAEAIKVIRDRFDRMSSAVFLDFTGMTVEEVSKLATCFGPKASNTRS